MTLKLRLIELEQRLLTLSVYFDNHYQFVSHAYRPLIPCVVHEEPLAVNMARIASDFLDKRSSVVRDVPREAMLDETVLCWALLSP